MTNYLIVWFLYVKQFTNTFFSSSLQDHFQFRESVYLECRLHILEKCILFPCPICFSSISLYTHFSANLKIWHCCFGFTTWVAHKVNSSIFGTRDLMLMAFWLQQGWCGICFLIYVAQDNPPTWFLRANPWTNPPHQSCYIQAIV